ncbi:MAG: deoxyribodipyrimidine photo-lyase, partial [Candidatus Nanopelagicales bacterium]|nr:deoxyribodipyrimidine photo-lyase [Candidatus Nanopelagicales bacterium]
MPDLHWFRRDLRIDDNPALAAAGPDAVAVFIHDPRLAGVGRVRQDYLDAAIKELNTQRPLLRRHGEPGAELLALARESGARRVYCAGDSTPFAARRDDAVEAVLAAHGIELRRIDSPFAVPPGELRTQAGAGFRV